MAWCPVNHGIAALGSEGEVGNYLVTYVVLAIAVGLLLGVAAVFLIGRNRQFLVGQTVSQETWDRAPTTLLPGR